MNRKQKPLEAAGTAPKGKDLKPCLGFKGHVTISTNRSSPIAFSDRKLVGIADTGRIMGIGRTRVYELLASGDLESVHLGQRHLVKYESIERFIDSLD